MLEAKNISVQIGEKTLLNDVSERFEPGKLNLIIGPNGAGKSTLIKVISQQMRKHEGAVFYNGENAQGLSERKMAQMRAVLSQNIDLAFPMKVWEVVMMGRYPHFVESPRQIDQQAVEEAMSFFNITDMAERNYLTLSGGEKQRVHFARVLTQIWYPKEGLNRFLLLDEPLTFLDVQYQFQFMHKIRDLLKSEDLVVIGVVHDLNLAARFGDLICLLHQGKLLASGAKFDVLSKENIRTVFQLEPVLYKDEERDLVHLFFE